MIRHNNTNQLRDLMNDTQNVPPALKTRLMEYVRGLLKKGLTHPHDARRDLQGATKPVHPPKRK